jgi:dTMP kinase
VADVTETRPRFIVVEGLDGSGKTSQVRRLCRRLQEEGIPTWQTFEPQKTGHGAELRQILADKEAGDRLRGSMPFLFALDRYDHVLQVQQALADGTWVVCDRYVLSSLAYNTEFMGLYEVLDLNRTFLVPDRTIILDCPVPASMKRIAARNEDRSIFESEAQLRRIDHAYRLGAQAWQAHGATCHVVSALGEPDDVHDRIWNHLQSAGWLP